MKPKDFKIIRRKAEMRQYKCAEFLRVTSTTVSNYETGKHAIPGPVAKLMELLRDGVTK